MNKNFVAPCIRMRHELHALELCCPSLTEIRLGHAWLGHLGHPSVLVTSKLRRTFGLVTGHRPGAPLTPPKSLPLSPEHASGWHGLPQPVPARVGLCASDVTGSEFGRWRLYGRRDVTCRCFRWSWPRESVTALIGYSGQAWYHRVASLMVIR